MKIKASLWKKSDFYFGFSGGMPLNASKKNVDIKITSKCYAF